MSAQIGVAIVERKTMRLVWLLLGAMLLSSGCGGQGGVETASTLDSAEEVTTSPASTTQTVSTEPVSTAETAPLSAPTIDDYVLGSLDPGETGYDLWVHHDAPEVAGYRINRSGASISEGSVALSLWSYSEDRSVSERLDMAHITRMYAAGISMIGTEASAGNQKPSEWIVVLADPADLDKVTADTFLLVQAGGQGDIVSINPAVADLNNDPEMMRAFLVALESVN